MEFPHGQNKASWNKSPQINKVVHFLCCWGGIANNGQWYHGAYNFNCYTPSMPNDKPVADSLGIVLRCTPTTSSPRRSTAEANTRKGTY